MKIMEVFDDSEGIVKQIANLEDVVYNKMLEDGREGQLFTTGYDDILEYAKSEENSVYATLEDDKVVAACYITQGQLPYTYNDLTKYFKNLKLYDSNGLSMYDEYLKKIYARDDSYLMRLLRAYYNKTNAFNYAVDVVLKESDYKTLKDYVLAEVAANDLHEKSKLRDGIFTQMAIYAKNNFLPDELNDYDKFFYYDFKRLLEALPEDQRNGEFARDLQERANVNDMDWFFGCATPTYVGDESISNDEKYFSANTSNTIEIDTYITDPSCKGSGYAKILVYEGIKKHIEKFFEDPENDELFLCSTLHKDNFPSKYVSEFFDLTDYVFVNRRQGRNREVHITRITRWEYMDYLDKMAAKLALFYGYNPDDREFSFELLSKVKREQYEYEKKELERIQSLRDLGPNANIMELKKKKVDKLK